VLPLGLHLLGIFFFSSSHKASVCFCQWSTFLVSNKCLGLVL
jgi:hypothetical protein